MSLNRTEATRLARECLPKILRNATAAGAVVENVTVKSLCRLWGGMGHVYQVTFRLKDGKNKKHQFVVKRVVPPAEGSRSTGDERKTLSYFVEAGFYENVAPDLIDEHDLSIPVPYFVERGDDDQVTICMSRLAGSPGSPGDEEIRAVLDWLATLHAATWGEKADEYVQLGFVQPIGSYWHLDTRPDEHDSMPRRGWEGRLKLAARAIDERLRRDEMQCCIHGDAKDANMLFERDGDGGVAVSMYDFQYCGKAPPSVDLAYFLCVAAEDTDPQYVEYYHQQLTERLEESGEECPPLKDLEESVTLALCDFQRFLSGWGKWGSDISSAVIEVLGRLDGGTKLASEDAYREAVRREFG